MPWRFPNIYGVDSFQALMLALSFARQYLQNFVDKGGQLWSDTDEPMSIEDLFGKGI